MSKSLAESAAEILKASMGAPKDPMVGMGAQYDVLGGSTNENPAGDAVGAVASAKAKVAPKPGTMGAPAEPMKKGAPPAEQVVDEKGLVKEEGELTEEEFAEYLNSLSEEELDEYLGSLSEEELAALGSTLEETEELDDSEEVEQIEEMGAVPTAASGKAPKPMPKKVDIKAMVKENMGSMKEDVDALFNGEALSEEFRDKATTIFEAAVKSRVEVVLEQVIAKNDEFLAERVAELETELAEKVDEYLGYVVEEWMSQNELAINSGLRAELAEDFINGLKNLFTEHYIEIPEEKIDVVDELSNKVLELESQLEEASGEFSTIVDELNEAKKQNAINDFCEGLTQMQKDKMKSLAEGVEFTTEGDFAKKLAVIRENYFPTKATTANVKNEEKKFIAETSDDNSEVETGSVMDFYVKAISKTVPKTGE
jgi:hypothetical protein